MSEVSPIEFQFFFKNFLSNFWPMMLPEACFFKPISQQSSELLFKKWIFKGQIGPFSTTEEKGA